MLNTAAAARPLTPTATRILRARKALFEAKKKGADPALRPAAEAELRAAIKAAGQAARCDLVPAPASTVPEREALLREATDLKSGGAIGLLREAEKAFAGAQTRAGDRMVEEAGRLLAGARRADRGLNPRGATHESLETLVGHRVPRRPKKVAA